MEARQLAYFVLACQPQNHAVAARQLGIAPSTLSASLAALEDELSISLFRRGAAGLYPTAGARWLYQEAEQILRTMELAPKAVAALDRPLAAVEIRSSLKFAVGRVHKAASIAIRSLADAFPATLFDLRFAVDEHASTPGPEDRFASEIAETRAGCVVITYCPSDCPNDCHDGGRGAVPTPLLSDTWVLVSTLPSAAQNGRPVDIGELERLRLILPDLPACLIDQALDYARSHGLPEPTVDGMDLAALPRLAADREPAHLLAPASALSARLDPMGVGVRPLAEPLISPLWATVETASPAATAFTKRMAEVFAHGESNVVFRPSLSLRQLRYFAVLAEELNVTLAARRLRIAQPALSGQLHKLEKALDATLFERHHNGLVATPAGRRLARLARTIAARTDRLRFHAATKVPVQRHRLRIGMIPMTDTAGTLVAAVVASLIAWTGRHPDVALQVLEAPSGTLHEWVSSGAVSFAVVELALPHHARIDLPGDEPLGVISAAHAGLLPPGPVALADLTGLRLVLPTAVFGLRQILDRASTAAGIRLVPAVEVNSLTAAVALLDQAPMATVLPASAAPSALSAGKLQFNPIVEPPLRRRLSVVFSAERSLTEVERTFVECLRLELAGETRSAQPEVAD